MAHLRADAGLGAALIEDGLYLLGGVAGDFADPDQAMYVLDLNGSPLRAKAEFRPAK